MDSDTFITDTIYEKFQYEYHNSNNIHRGYIKFIKSKNLGIECIDINIGSQLLDRYKIVDEKKWLINKIKYGI